MILVESHITSTVAARNFSDILNRVAYRGESFVVERSGRPVCRIVPVETKGMSVREFAEVLESAPKPDPGYWDDVEKAIRDQPSLPDVRW